jgi:thioesterase domain-containing protein/NAD(P)-dependent dehydrogenase (short-subunit alcohol dehydrogenase family)/acyl carrier protein
VIPQESARLRCRNIDIAPPSGRKDAAVLLGEQLLPELWLPQGDAVVAYRGMHRWVQSYVVASLPAPDAESAAFRPQGTYLITGGLGEIGLLLASYLAQHFQAKLVLTARSSLPPRQEWAEWLARQPEENGTSRRIRQIMALEEVGAEVLVVSADVADFRQMQDALDQAHARFGRLHGVIHAAGIVAGTRLNELDREQCEAQFHAKGRGLVVLAKVLDKAKYLQNNALDFCLVTSSLSTVLGGLGYAAYAAANAYMDAFVHAQNRRQASRWTAVNWDAWHFAAPVQSGGRLSNLAELAMTQVEGVETFARVLSAAPGNQVVVSTGELQVRLDQWVRMEKADEATSPAAAVHTLHLARAAGKEYVAPRNAGEEALADIWRNLLGVQELGVHDDYFDLGGSSLVAVRLFDQIERKFGVKLPLATLFDAPTIAQLAEVLSDVDVALPQTPKAAKGWSPLVAIQPKGTRPPLFCVHAAGGNVLLYHDLARYLGQDQPVYGVQAQGLDGKLPILERVEEMAEVYVREIKLVQPHGPYLIAGYCMGGTVALEMAQQLVAKGEEVAFLALFETYNWRNMRLDTWGEKLIFLAQKLGFHIGNFLQLDQKGRKTFLDEKIKVAKSRREVALGTLLSKLGRLAEAHTGTDLLPTKVWETNDLAALEYVPGRYPGKITHFRPAKEYRCHIGPALGWEALAQEVEVQRVPVYPAGMLVDPFVAELAACVRDCIDRGLKAKDDASESAHVESRAADLVVAG